MIEFTFQPLDGSPASEQLTFEIWADPDHSTRHVLALVGRIWSPDPHLKRVELRYHTEVLAVCPINRAEPAWSLKRGLPSETRVRFSAMLLASALPGRFSITVSTFVEGAGSQLIGHLVGSWDRFEGLRPAEDTGVSSLMVTSAGRSGSTLMMKLLSSLEEVVAPAFYPYETRNSIYYWRAHQVTCTPGQHGISMGPDAFEASGPRIGYNPYFTDIYLSRFPSDHVRDWLSDASIEESAAFTRRMVAGYADALRQDFAKPQARFIAEKTLPTTLINVITRLDRGAKEIFLVRDFRDTFLSAWSFNQKRQTQSFGMRGRPFDEELAASEPGVRQIAGSYRDRKDQCLLIRYEDLVSTPDEQFSRIADFIGVERGHALAAMRQVVAADQAQSHATSDSPEQSAGRWRREMTEEQIQFTADQFGPALETFGYELA